MITLYTYPDLFGVADNNPYGLKVFTFLKLCNQPFQHAPTLDPRDAPRAQLPYIVDDNAVIGDSDAIIDHLIKKYRLTIDSGLTPAIMSTGLMVRRTLDDLYWVMSYSRWKDERFWPLFRNSFLKTHSAVSEGALDEARRYNLQRYHYQGIGRYEPEAVYERGAADLHALACLMRENGYMFGPKPCSIDAGIFGFVANIYFYEIETPLKARVASHPNLVRHCTAMRTAAPGSVA